MDPIFLLTFHYLNICIPLIWSKHILIHIAIANVSGLNERNKDLTLIGDHDSG